MEDTQLGQSRILMVPFGSGEPVNVLSEKDTMIRMRKGLEMWQDGGWDFLLVCGGTFTSKKIMTITGAIVMKQWFVDQKVPASQIIIDDQSRDTYQNVAFSIDAICGRLGLPIKATSITVVTQWQHAIRFWLTFKSYGVNVNLKKLSYPMGIAGIIREFVLIAVTALDPRGRVIGTINQRLFRQNR